MEWPNQYMILLPAGLLIDTSNWTLHARQGFNMIKLFEIAF